MDFENTDRPNKELSESIIKDTEENKSGNLIKEKRNYGFTLEGLKKKVRLSEFLAEKIITGVAFLSIAIIILIFLFVFKETLPIFSTKSGKKTEMRSSNKPEQYGISGNKKEDLKQEVYTGQENNKTIEKQEVYMGNSGNQPEKYGTTGNNAQPATISREDSLLLNNRVIAPDIVTVKGLLGKEWMPVSDNPRYGLVPLIIGTFKITIIAILFAAPLAILAALFSAAFAPKWLREIIKPAIELLAGFPSVVIGFFALMVMATFFQQLFGYSTRLNAFVGGVAMALAAIPIIFTITEDVMTAVPSTYKEASLALGASRWQTAFFVTLPAATPGIFAAILLGIGRIFGETMIALMATGNAALISMNPFDSVRTLSATIGAEMAEVVFGDTHYSVLFLIGTLLFIFTFTLNATAEFYVKGKLMRRFQGRTT
jgi:phosphate transport system permease protein